MTTVNEQKKQHIINRLKNEGAQMDAVEKLVEKIRAKYWELATLNDLLIDIVGTQEDAEKVVPHDGDKWRCAFAADSMKEGIDWVGFGLDRLPPNLGGLSSGELNGGSNE